MSNSNVLDNEQAAMFEMVMALGTPQLEFSAGTRKRKNFILFINA
jgi:hypothetical protein